jgi:hypothetical protein
MVDLNGQKLKFNQEKADAFAKTFCVNGKNCMVKCKNQRK